MHILVLPSWYFSPDTHEIAGRMFHSLAKNLRAFDVDARVLYSSYGVKEPFFKTTQMATEDGVPTWRINGFFPPKANSFLFNQWRKRCVKDILIYIKKEGQPDVIHAHSYHAASVCALLQTHISIPYVYTERLSSFLTGNIPRYHHRFIEKCCAYAVTITTVSPGLQKQMNAFTQRTVEVVPNYFDEAIFYPDQQIEKEEVFTWVSIGEPSHTKGLDILLRSFAALKDKVRETPMQLILVDHIPEKKKLLVLAKRLGIGEYIQWIGLITQQEVADLLRRSHVLVSASRVETFGKAIIEAQACGLPVVATKTDGASFTMTSPWQGELAEINSKDALMEAMSAVYSNYLSYDPKSINKMAGERFSKGVVIPQWIACYKTLQA